MTEAQLTLGESLRDEGTERVLSSDDYRAIQWRAYASLGVSALAHRGQDFVADDVREIAGDPPKPNMLGALLSQARKAGVIRCVGYQLSERKERHAALVRVWRGVER